ncbi:MAG: GNAT family N-acetyltransferase [Dehalococcoidia bacterium]
MTADLVALGDANYYEAWAMLARAAYDGDVRDLDGVLVTTAGTPVLWLNIAFVTRRLPDPEAQLSAARAYFDERGLPFLVRIREGLDEDAERAAGRLGMPYTDTIPGMALDPIPPAPDATAPLAIEEVDARTLDAFVTLNAEAFDIPLEACRKVLPPDILEEPHAHWYLGLADGKPAATSGLVITDGIAGVHFVSTDATYRRRGFGEAMTRHAALEGRKRGLSVAYLQSSEMGYPVYERMGYRRVTGYKTFVTKET